MRAGGAAPGIFAAMRRSLSRPLVLLGGVALAGPPRPGAAQPASPLPPAFYATYAYRAYSVVNPGSGEPPARIPGAGGTLRLRPDGRYAKRLRLQIGAGPPREFNQQGRFTTQGDSIFFLFTDPNGTDTQRGTFRYQPATRQLTITIAGYPPGNAGIYELTAAPDSAAPAPMLAAPRRPRPAAAHPR